MANRVYKIRDRLTNRFLVAVDRENMIYVGRWNLNSPPLNLVMVRYLISRLVKEGRKFELSTADVVAYDLVEAKTTTTTKKIIDQVEQQLTFDRLKSGGSST